MDADRFRLICLHYAFYTREKGERLVIQLIYNLNQSKSIQDTKELMKYLKQEGFIRTDSMTYMKTILENKPKKHSWMSRLDNQMTVTKVWFDKLNESSYEVTVLKVTFEGNFSEEDTKKEMKICKPSEIGYYEDFRKEKYCFSCYRKYFEINWYTPSCCPHCNRTFID